MPPSASGEKQEGRDGGGQMQDLRVICQKGAKIFAIFCHCPDLREEGGEEENAGSKYCF